jgi:hypothetical protein
MLLSRAWLHRSFNVTLELDHVGRIVEIKCVGRESIITADQFDRSIRLDAFQLQKGVQKLTTKLTARL